MTETVTDKNIELLQELADKSKPEVKVKVEEIIKEQKDLRKQDPR